MRKHGGTPSRRDKHVTLAAISPPGVARGRFVGGERSGLAGSKPPPLFTRGASSCSSQGRRQGKPWGASPRPSAPTYLPTWNAVSAPSDDEWPEGLTEDGDKLFLKDKLLVPENRMKELIDHWHNSQLMHPRRDKMQQYLEWRFKFPPGYYAILDKYRSDCAMCPATKSPNHSTAGNPVYTAIPEAPMRSVAMHVFAMPEVTVEGETYDCVILAVDRHSG